MARVITRPRRFREVALMGRLTTFLYIITAPYEGAVIKFSEYRWSNRFLQKEYRSDQEVFLLGAALERFGHPYRRFAASAPGLTVRAAVLGSDRIDPTSRL